MTTARHWLIIDDDPVFADTLARALSQQGLSVATARDADAALTAVAAQTPDRIVLDLKLGDDHGLTLLPALLAHAPDARVLVLTGYSSIATAVEAIKRGAWQYLPKPATGAAIVQALEAERETPPPVPAHPPSVERLEWEHIQRVLQAHDGNISATARALGMHRRTLQRKLDKHAPHARRG
jgi:two-component system response regulator RegA